MKIETQILEDHQAKLTVEVEIDELEGMKRRAASKIARQVKIPGFRPGKAPYPVIVRHVGEAAVIEEALELLVDDIYPKILEEANIKPYGPGKLENVLSMDPLQLEFVVPMEAEVDLGDYRSIRKLYQPVEITEQDIEEALNGLRERQAIIEPVDRPAQDGDLVTVRLSANRVQPEEGQDSVLIREGSFPIIIRPVMSTTDESTSDEVAEWPFPGFPQHLIGLSENDEKSIQYTYPQDAAPDSMRGVEAEFHFVVLNVKSRRLPELDGVFIASLGDFEDLEALRKHLHSTLENQARQSFDEKYSNEILEEAIQQAIFKYPLQMLDRELDRVIDELKGRLENQRLDLDLYLKTRNLDMDGFKEELRPVAESRIKRRLFLVKLSEVENIKIEPDELKDEARSTFDYLYRNLPKTKARKLSEDDAYSNLVSNIYVDMLSRRSIERLRDICSGKLEQEQINTKFSEPVEIHSGDQLNDQDEIKLNQIVQLEQKMVSDNNVLENNIEDIG